MTEIDTRAIVDYELSKLGRTGYLVFAGVSLLGLAFFLYTLVSIAMKGGAGLGWWVVVLFLLFTAAFAGLTVVAGLRAFGPSLRISLTREGFKYQGLFQVLRVRWVEVESYRLSHGALFDHLRVALGPEARGGARKLMLDVSNLNPPVSDVLEAFAEGTGKKPLGKKQKS